MNRQFLRGLAYLFLLVSLAGVCIAEDIPGSVVYLQGGESSITNGSDGMPVVTVQDLVQYVHVTDGKKSILIPVQQLTNMTAPMNAALVLSGEDKESTFVVEVSNLSLSDGNNTLTLQVNPLEFYEGSVLKSFSNVSHDWTAEKQERYPQSGIYLEWSIPVPKNKYCYSCDCDPFYGCKLP